MNASKSQIKAINAILATRGLMDEKKNIVRNVSNDRTERSSELTDQEARKLLIALNDKPPTIEDIRKERMARKVVAMAREINWVKKEKIVTPTGIEEINNYSALHGWMLKYSYLKKSLNQYTYLELPKLVTQFENGPYSHYIRGI